MQHDRTTQAIALALTTLATATVLGGCVYRRETAVPSASPTTVVVTPPAAQRVVTYPEGRYELRGDGSTTSPYFWVWIPTGATTPNPPPLPRAR